MDDGVEEVVQDGFDKGYTEGAAAGWEAGMLYGAAAATAAALAQAPTLSTIGVGGSVGGAQSSQVEDGASTVVAVVAGQHGGHNIGASVVQGGAHCRDRRQTEEGTVAGAGDGEDGRRPSQEGSSRRIAELSDLVDELKHASLLGPNAPQLDKAHVLGKLQLAGSAGAAVAAAVDE